MMKLVDMPGISAKFRICRMQTANFKKVGRKFKGPFCAPKLRVPEYPFGDVFCMRGGELRKKGPHMFKNNKIWTRFQWKIQRKR